MFSQQDDKLVFRYDDETLWIEPWNADALRVRATKQPSMPAEDWALGGQPREVPSSATINLPKDPKGPATISNGNIKAVVSHRGKITMYNGKGDKILEEYARHKLDLDDEKCSPLNLEARELRNIPGCTDARLTLRLESLDADERIYGMGQYQYPFLNLKGTDLELAHRNSQASVPFAVSSLGYGFLWNNPAVGRATFGKNVTSWEGFSCKSLDYWIVAGETPAEISESFSNATGHAPMMPEYGLGFWQCKLRYQSQEELLTVAREYQKRQIPLDVIVVDFFHWVHQGEWSFDPKYWPDPKAMVDELKSMNVELMVSIWPTVENKSKYYDEMIERGLLVRSDRGVRVAMQVMGDTTHLDATNPEARKFIWEKAKKSYHDLGIKIFWLDEAEPEYSYYDFDLYRYHAGPVNQIGNVYPKEYARAFYEGMLEAGQSSDLVNLLRCAWVGSQKYGALVWSGDIASSWDAFRCQLTAGLNMGMAGIPWWTTDIGGFHGGAPADPKFRELFVRWFQWGAFCPVMRLHGDRQPKPDEGDGTFSGAPNEVWSYGEEVYGICVKYIELRERMRDYTRSLMEQAQKGAPVMRTLFYEFPKDKRAWTVEDQYMYGSKYLVAPILWPGQKKRTIYLPEGASWKLMDRDGSPEWEGGREVEVECSLEWMPVVERL